MKFCGEHCFEAQTRMSRQSLISVVFLPVSKKVTFLECLQILGINSTLMKFLGKTMKDWRVELTCANESLGEVKVKRGLFQGDALLPLPFVITLIPLTSVLKMTKTGKNLQKNREKINHLLYMDDLKLYAKSEKEHGSLIQTVRVFSKDIGMQFGIEKWSTLVIRR